MKKELLEKYARAIATIGANPKKGQPVILTAQADQWEFANMVTEELYKAGAGSISLKWECQKNSVLRYTYEDEDTLSCVHKYEEAQWQEMVDTLPCRVLLDSEDPDGLKNAPMEKVQRANQKRRKIYKPYRDAVDNLHQWVIAAVPSKEWAKKVYPNESDENALEHLWREILSSCHIDENSDPVEAWKKHNETLRTNAQKMTDYNFQYLTYKSPNGTDFKCELLPDGIWCGGSAKTKGNVEFSPNMPTEEVFTSPLRGKCEGTLTATKPLSYMGNLIENFSITFKDGKAVSCKAEKGQEILEKMISMDENAAYLGELALVPVDSPISRSNVLFYNTLFDENAACHVALGAGFNECVRDFEKYTEKELFEKGINDSIIHVDFMIGCDTLEITGHTNDGRDITVFKNGNWAI